MSEIHAIDAEGANDARPRRVAEEPSSEPGTVGLNEDPCDRDLARVSAVWPLGDSERFGTRLDPSWFAQRGPNGGYLAAIFVRAFDRMAGQGALTARSLTLHYHSAASP